MPQVHTHDSVLEVEVDGEGDPITVFAHGLTNSRRESSVITPMLQGTKIRFDFRAHGLSSAPETGYAFADFGRDLEAVADEYEATRAVGTSLGAGALCNLLTRRPDRFERLVFLFPAALDLPFEHKEKFLETVSILEQMPREEALATLIDGDPDARETRMAQYAKMPWMRDIVKGTWEETDLSGLARAIRGVLESSAVETREQLRAVETPTLIICRDDPVHPLMIGEAMAEVMPNAELMVFADDQEIMESIPILLARANEFLA